MENENENVVEQDDIAIIDELNARHQAELDAKDAKYAQLLRAYSRGERASAETSHEKTAAELKSEYESNIKEVADNQLNDLEQAKRILAIRQYRLDSGEPDIFLPDIGTPSPEDIDSAQNIADLLEYAIDRSDGNNKIFVSTLESRLVDNRYLR